MPNRLRPSTAAVAVTAVAVVLSVGSGASLGLAAADATTASAPSSTPARPSLSASPVSSASPVPPTPSVRPARTAPARSVPAGRRTDDPGSITVPAGHVAITTSPGVTAGEITLIAAGALLLVGGMTVAIRRRR